MIEKINLKKFDYIFSDTTLSNLEKKTFIYGKNGVGKSTIVNAIKQEYDDNFDLRIFNGWRGTIGDNYSIEAISLGDYNTEVLEEIKSIEDEIVTNKNILNSNNNLLGLDINSKMKFKEHDFNQQNNKVEKIYTDTAREVSKTLSLHRSYTKSHLKGDIKLANELDKDTVSKLTSIIKSSIIDYKEPKKLYLNSIDCKSLIEKVNSLIHIKVTPSMIIEEFESNKDKMNFAKKGQEIHNHNDNCAFCGGVISDDRWKELDSYFSDTFKKIDKDIDDLIRQLNSYLHNLQTAYTIDKSEYYKHLHDKVDILNNDIKHRYTAYQNFLHHLEVALINKKEQLSEAMSYLDIEIPTISDLNEKFNSIISDNKKFTENIQEEKNKAKTKLKLHYIAIELNNHNYQEEKETLDKCKRELDDASEEKTLIETKIKSLEKKLESKKTSYSDESLAAKYINEVLKSLGNRSFSLEYVSDINSGQGQYHIKSNSGEHRSFQTLSDGEKNFIAFLWFMNNIKVKNDISKKMVVIFDDPMNSNDDIVQYLMISIIKSFYSDQSSPQMILLTHNNYFYQHVTPNNKKYPTDKKPSCSQKYIRLNKVKNKTNFEYIENENNQIKSLYEELWYELKFAYSHNKVVFMWNIMRRILESYNLFNYKTNSLSELKFQMKDYSSRILAESLIKSLHNNSHIGVETSIDISDKTKDELIEVLSSIFTSLNQEDHFSTYWMG